MTMEKALANAVNELKIAMNEDSRIKALEVREKAMMENEEVLLLMANKDRAEREYEDVLSYSSKDEEKTKVAQHNLYLAKKKLDEHPLVKEYMVSYSEVRNLYSRIDDILFSSYRKKGHICSK